MFYIELLFVFIMDITVLYEGYSSIASNIEGLNQFSIVSRSPRVDLVVDGFIIIFALSLLII